jgi:spore coat-associated protein N
MRKILIATLALALVATLAGLGTFAWFSDTETVVGTFTTGTIRLKVNKPTGLQFAIGDLKPCDWKTQAVQLEKDGTNDGPVWLHIDGIDGANTDLAAWLDFDLKNTDTGEVLIHPDDHMKITDLKSVSIKLGWLSTTMNLELSFHLAADTPNEMQGKSCTVNFEFIMTDHNGGPPTNGIILENKNEASGWKPILGDGIWGICRYDVGSLNLDVVGKGLDASTVYQVGITSPERASWYPVSEADRQKMASALASGVYASGAGMGTAPPSGFNLFERGYCQPGAGLLQGTYNDGDVGVYTFTNSGVTPGGVTGAQLAARVSKSCSLPAGVYKYIKVIIKIDASPYTGVLMEKDTPLFFTIP